MQLHILFKGQVQGVGFRFTTQQAARELGLTGWVKNLPDGSVEVIAEGDTTTVMALLEELQDRFGGYITDCLKHEVLPDTHYDKFEIRY